MTAPSPAPLCPVARRKLGLLQQAGLFGHETKGATIRRACTAQDLRAAYRLVHDVFLGTGYTRSEPAGIRLRMFEASEEMATFVAVKDGEVVGVLSVVGDTCDLGLPSDTAFRPELDALRASGRRVCEMTNQAIAEQYRHSAVPTELMRCAIAHGIKAGYEESVATVSPGHHGFYELVGFRRLGSVRSYSQKLHDPVIALTMDLNLYRHPAPAQSDIDAFLHQFAGKDNHFLTQVVDWTNQAARNFRDPELLQQLFAAERNFLAECTGAQLSALERCWGKETFRAVLHAAQGEIEAFVFAPDPADDSPWNLFSESEFLAEPRYA